MNCAKITSKVIALSQIVLGGLFLFTPALMLRVMGIPPLAEGVNYPLAMFAARLLVYGVVMLIICRDLRRHRLWLDGMAAIQAIDLAAGLYYCSAGITAWSSSALPMVNAGLFLAALLLTRRSLCDRPAAAV